MYGENPDLVPTVLDTLRRGDFATLLETLDLDEREDFTIAVPPGSGLTVETMTLIRYGNSQAILHVGGSQADVTLGWHAHDNEADAIECHEWKANSLRDLAAAAYAAANGPVGRAFMKMRESGALDEIMRAINGDN